MMEISSIVLLYQSRYGEAQGVKKYSKKLPSKILLNPDIGRYNIIDILSLIYYH
jgi:hypothetical protein